MLIPLINVNVVLTNLKRTKERLCVKVAKKWFACLEVVKSVTLERLVLVYIKKITLPLKLKSSRTFEKLIAHVEQCGQRFLVKITENALNALVLGVLEESALAISLIEKLQLDTNTIVPLENHSLQLNVLNVDIILKLEFNKLKNAQNAKRFGVQLTVARLKVIKNAT